MGAFFILISVAYFYVQPNNQAAAVSRVAPCIL